MSLAEDTDFKIHITLHIFSVNKVEEKKIFYMSSLKKGATLRSS